MEVEIYVVIVVNWFYLVEYWLCCCDGGECWVFEIGRVLCDVEGILCFIDGVMVDISEVKCLME